MKKRYIVFHTAAAFCVGVLMMSRGRLIMERRGEEQSYMMFRSVLRQHDSGPP